jgi:hypothetical protein
MSNSDKYMFIFFNILIAGGLISYNSGIVKDYKLNNIIDKISESNTYKWGVMITHFLAYLFLINHISSSSKQGILDNQIKILMKKYLASFSEKAVVAFNLANFNYIFPGAFILELIAGAIYKYCNKSSDSKKGFMVLLSCIKSVINGCHSFFKNSLIIKCIIFVLIISYILNLSKIECNPNITTDNDGSKVSESSGPCWWINLVILGINLFLTGILILYLAKSNNQCTELFGLPSINKVANNSEETINPLSMNNNSNNSNQSNQSNQSN